MTEATPTNHSWWKRQSPAFLASLAAHAVLLAVLIVYGSRAGANRPRTVSTVHDTGESAIAAGHTDQTPWLGSCSPIRAGPLLRLVEYAKRVVADPASRDPLRAKILLHDSSLVTPVMDDKLCWLAVQAINRARGLPRYKRDALSIVSVGNRYLAEDVALRSPDYRLGYLVDSTLGRVMFQYRR